MPYPNVTNELPPELHNAVQYQEHLWLGPTLHGCVAYHWAYAIDQLNPYLAFSGKQVLTQFIQAVWTYILASWTICNKHLHPDAGNLSLANYQQAVQTLYERGAQLPSCARSPV